MKRVLALLTSHDRLGESGRKTGFSLEELATLYYALAGAGIGIALASPAGGRPPVDPVSRESSVAEVRRFLDDRVALATLEHTTPLASITEEYDGYVVVGGHGALFDLASSAGAFVGAAWRKGKLVAAVCHGPAALLGAADGAGVPIVKGRRIAGSSNAEERARGSLDALPLALETRLVELGAHYECGTNFQPFALRDGNLVTGQNSESAAAVAKLLIDGLC